MTPKVSVILPTYNCADLIEKAIDSILIQTFSNFELLIIDDGSSDNTKELIGKYDDSRIQYFYKNNSGLGDTLNFGINVSKGEYLLRMDSDDISEITRIAKLVTFMDNNLGVALCGSNVSYFINDIGNENIYHRSFPQFHDEILDGLLNLSHVICHPSIIIRKECAILANNYQIKGVGEDWDFFLQLSKTGKLANYPECLYYMRMNPKSITHTKWGECYVNNTFSVKRYHENLDIKLLTHYKDQYLNSRTNRIDLKLDTYSLNIYRKGLQSYIYGNKLGYFGFLALSALFSPKRLLNRIKGLLVQKRTAMN